MKRYLVFAYGTYYPFGGWRDFVSAHETFEDAFKAAREAVKGEEGDDVAEIIDMETMQEVKRVIWKEVR